MHKSQIILLIAAFSVIGLFAEGVYPSFKLQAGASGKVQAEKIAPLNEVSTSGQAVSFESFSQPASLPALGPNPNIPPGAPESVVPEHFRRPADRLGPGGVKLLPLSDPKATQIPVVQAVQEAKDKLTVLWAQYMKVATENSPTYQTYFNWAAELGPSKMGCLERYMACTDWCGTKGIENGFPNCDPAQNGKQFIPGDPSECARPLNKLPQDPTQPWPGGSGC